MTVKHAAQVARLERSIALALCESTGSPRALTVALLIRHECWKELLDLTCDPLHYNDGLAFERDYQVTAMLQKNPRLPTGIDTEQVAIEKFWAAEAHCAESNQRLSNAIKEGVFPSTDVLACLVKAQEHIGRILGPLTRTKLRYAEDNMRFGPGATTSLSGIVTQGKKYSRRTLDATPRILDFRLFSFPQKWRELSVDIRLRKSSKLRVVPKNAKTGRTICVEPDLNIFVQLGIGALIRDQLARSGLDLSTQENNQRLARDAWKNDLCTMDLSSASDTICREVVWLLLPFEWADLLHFARVDFVELPGVGEKLLQKWSSMGNGYTFELETLIFYGVLLGAAGLMGFESWSVIAYGDDLIFPNGMRDLVERTLNFLGFKVNHEKTFGKSVFHESCGTDWFMGRNVRPFFMRSEHHDFPSVCYTYANRLVEVATRRSACGYRDVSVLPAWIRCFTAVPHPHRHRIPQGFGDVGFVSSFDEACPTTPSGGRRGGWAGLHFQYREVEAYTMRVSEEGCLTAFLNGNRTEWSLARETLRGRPRTAATRRGYCLQWPHLGPWI